MVGVLIIVGMLIGAGASSGGGGELLGAALGAGLGWAIATLRAMSQRILTLERRLAAQQTQAPAAQQARPPAAADARTAVAAPAAHEAAPEPASEATSTAHPLPQAADAMPLVHPPLSPKPVLEPATEPALEPALNPPLEPAPKPTPPRPPPAAAALPGALHNLIFGGNTIVKAGVAILFIGLAFLARFAAEHVHIAMQWRLAGIGLVAVVLLAIGWRLREKRRAYSLVLQGGAVAVLYLTLFAAFRFYGLMALGPAFGFMVLVAALAAALAVLQDAPALAITGALGGFATPILLSTGGGHHVPLFSYYLVLDLGILAIGWWRHWRALNLLAFVCTYGVAAAWGLRSFRPEHALSCELFLIAFFLLFAAVTLTPARHARAGDPAPASGDVPAPVGRWIHASLLFGVPTVTMALQYGIWRGDEAWMGLTALVLGAFYIGLAAWARRAAQRAAASATPAPGAAALAALHEPVLAIGAVLATLVVPFGFDARVTSGAWALEGAGLLWAGLRQHHGLTRVSGYALLFLSGIAAGYAHGDGPTPVAPFNAVLVNALLIGAAGLAAAYFLHRTPLPLKEPETAAEAVLIGWATLWLLGAVGFEITHYVSDKLALAVALVALAGLALLYLALALRLAWRRLALVLMAHAPWLALAVAASAATHPAPHEGGGWWAWPLAIGAQLAVLRWAAREAPDGWPLGARRATHALGPLVVAGLGAFELRHLTADWGDALSAWPWLGWLAAPAIVLGLLLWSGRRTPLRWPLADEPPAYGTIAAGVLAASLLAWAMLANIASSGAAQPLPHVPLVNPLDLGIGIALAAAWAWWRSAGPAAFAQRFAKPALAVLGAAAFLWLNGMLIRAFHHWGGVRYHLDAWVRSLAVQTGLTLLWSALALALMWWSARRAQRAAWVTGAALLALVVVKLLLVDLSGTGTVTRIVSFIGVGVLMLVIGYVAPLPGKAEGATPHGSL